MCVYHHQTRNDLSRCRILWRCIKRILPLQERKLKKDERKNGANCTSYIFNESKSKLKIKWGKNEVEK